MNNSHDDSNDLLTDGPLVSVGITTYNRPESLRRALKCITGQTYKNLEIIVSNDCSPVPETEAVVLEFMAKDNRIQYYRQETNIGPAFNYQFVLDKATGEYFMWADDDDEWEFHFIYRLLDLLLQNHDISVAMSGVKVVDDGGIIVGITQYRELLTPDYNQFRFAVFAASHDVIAFYMSALYRISTLKKFYKNLNNSFGSDMVLICELLLSTKFGSVDEVLHIRHNHTKGTAERHPETEIGKNYGDPLNYLKLLLSFGPSLLRSSNIPIKHKFWIPFMVMRQGIWIGKIYVNQIFLEICLFGELSLKLFRRL